MQTDATLLANNTQQCCDLLRPFAWAFTQLGRESQQEHYKTMDLIISRIQTLHVGMPSAGHLYVVVFGRENVKNSVLWFSGEREEQSMNQFKIVRPQD